MLDRRRRRSRALLRSWTDLRIASRRGNAGTTKERMMPRVSATPRASGSVTLRDGRLLAYAEWGDPAGRPVVMFHGNPATRLQCPDEDGSAAAGVRLIT